KIALRQTMDAAQFRAGQIARHLTWDLNGDGQVDATERSRFTGDEAAGVETAFANGDADRNGVLTFAEIAAIADAQIALRMRNDRFLALMAFDFDDDGQVTAEEITRTMDVLGDDPLGFSVDIETHHRESLLQQRMKEQEALNPSRCDAPKPSPSARFIALSGYEGGALSTVSVTGLDEVTQIATIEIEPGDTPVYLIVGAYETIIWEVIGATDRVEAFVAQGGGVLGLAQDKVHHVPQNGCFKYVTTIDGGDGALAYRKLEKEFGKAPNLMLARYTIGQIAVPSGTAAPEAGDGDGVDVLVLDGKRFEVTPDGLKPLDEASDQLPGAGPFGASQTLRSFLRFHPGGLREVDAEAVNAAKEAVPYDVYPQQAGLLQLILDGRMSFTRDGYYVIDQSIPRFPAGLYGSHSVQFILAEGIEMPAGTPGHSSVRSEETGACLTRMCRP
ncbi:MAG: hypothetical protein AAF230_03165, partial [Pseudomonadota bacterium]